MVSGKFLRLIISFLHQAYPQNVILLSERVLLTSQVECDAGQCLHSITVDFILQDQGGRQVGLFESGILLLLLERTLHAITPLSSSCAPMVLISRDTEDAGPVM